jgi:hypothetical protein
MRNSKLVVALIAAGAACSKAEAPQRSRAPAAEMAKEEAPAAAAPVAVQATSPYGADKALGYDPTSALGALMGAQAGGALADVLAGGAVGEGGGGKRGGARSELDEPAVVTRSWFPETFLFEPLVVTDNTGNATLSVRVPDRLTSWRVLALGHTRTGAQGGAVTSFLGTLPVYVDPIVPKTLLVGDEIMIPIQIVNTSSAPVSTSLTVEVNNATISAPKQAHTIPGGGTHIEYARLHVERAGDVLMRVALSNTDAVLRSIKVVPSGRQVSTNKSGTLAAPRTFSLAGIPNADPTTDRVRLIAFPGALSLFHSELGCALARTTAADTAYALLLSGSAKRVLTSLGDKPDPDAIRELAILAGQRAIRDGRNLDVPTAALFSQAGLTETDNPVLQRLGKRAADFLAQSQLPDGTFKGPNGRTVQHMLVASAEAIRAVASLKATAEDERRATAMSARALSTFSQNLIHVEDGYTAAAILATGAVSGALAEDLRVRVLASIKVADDGARYLEVGDGVVRADGMIPSRSEATAMAVLALGDDAKATLADLGATLLGSYSMAYGWGDGRANMLAMLAVLKLFKEPVASDVRITLTMDGKPVLEGLLDRNKMRHVVSMDALAPGLADGHQWKIVADPPLPGLGYALTLESWVPWTKDSVQQGLELSLPETVKGTVGVPTPITITAATPAGMTLHVHHAIPVGVQVDTTSLEELVASGVIQRFAIVDGAVDLYASERSPGQMFSATYRVIPTFPGTLHSAASLIEAGGTTFHVPPASWSIGSAKGTARSSLANAAPP